MLGIVPIPCAACRKPVHERSVKCPHCGGATGVTPDAKWTAEERLAAVELARIESLRNVPPPSYGMTNASYNPDAVLLDVVGAVVKGAIDAVARAPEREAELPRAVARERRKVSAARAPRSPAPPRSRRKR
jgi:hypothetical protein